MRHRELKERHRLERAGWHQNLSLRVHRALSWLKRAEDAEDDDGKLIFLWIAFNAAYATELDNSQPLSEKGAFQLFINKLCDLDCGGKLYEQVWGSFSDNLRIFLNNPFVFQAFWDFQTGRVTERDWKESFSRANAAATRALGKKDTSKALSIIMERVYTLRNQLVHGGATFDSSVNREQVRGAVRFLGQSVPIIIEIMMDHPETLWGDACYPVVNI